MSMFESGGQRRRYDDLNKYRVMVKRLQINPSRKNLDVQNCVLELEDRAKSSGDSFVMSDFLMDMIRRGITSLVEKHPEAATPSMLHIAKEFDPNMKVPEVHDIRPPSDSLIPSVIDYHKKDGINGQSLRNVYFAGLISEKDLLDMWITANRISYEILSDPVLGDILDKEVKKRPDLFELSHNTHVAFQESCRRGEMF